MVHAEKIRILAHHNLLALQDSDSAQIKHVKNLPKNAQNSLNAHQTRCINAKINLALRVHQIVHKESLVKTQLILSVLIRLVLLVN
jgi:hypothetical protein